ncbi:MAG: GNAT family N-acetyltransferase [Rhizobiaceae bacterium]
MFGQTRKKFLVLDASANDHASMAELHASAFSRAWSKSEVAGLWAQENVIMLIARTVGEPDGPVLGFNIVRKSGDEAEILSIATDEKARGRGIGETLIREAILRLRADRVGALVLEVDGANQPAIRLYERLGFHTVANRPGYYRKEDKDGLVAHSAALVMRLDLV